MPRKRRTQSGADAQPVDPGEGQGYGQAKEQAEMQQAMPAPQTHGSMITASTPSPGSAPPPDVAASQQPVDVAALLGQAPIGLLGGTRRPNEPVTAGLASGPGPGPKIGGPLNPATPLGRTMRLLAERTGDPLFQQLADRAGL